MGSFPEFTSIGTSIQVDMEFNVAAMFHFHHQFFLIMFFGLCVASATGTLIENHILVSTTKYYIISTLSMPVKKINLPR